MHALRRRGLVGECWSVMSFDAVIFVPMADLMVSMVGSAKRQEPFYISRYISEISPTRSLWSWSYLRAFVGRKADLTVKVGVLPQIKAKCREDPLSTHRVDAIVVYPVFSSFFSLNSSGWSGNGSKKAWWCQPCFQQYPNPVISLSSIHLVNGHICTSVGVRGQKEQDEFGPPCEFFCLIHRKWLCLDGLMLARNVISYFKDFRNIEGIIGKGGTRRHIELMCYISCTPGFLPQSNPAICIHLDRTGHVYSRNTWLFRTLLLFEVQGNRPSMDGQLMMYDITCDDI